MGEITRRGALQGLSVGIGIAATGCGAEVEEPAAGNAGGDTPPAGQTNNSPAPGGTTPPAQDPPKQDPVLTPKQLLAGVDHIVVLMMENRSFDHFLGALKTDKGYVSAQSVDGLAGTETNPAPDGGA